MLYPFMTLDDGTEIVHSETIEDNGKEKVKVVMETPIMGGFKHAECWLPDYKWQSVEGYSKEEISDLELTIKQHTNVIWIGISLKEKEKHEKHWKH